MRGTKPGLNNVASKKPSAASPQLGGCPDEVSGGPSARAIASPATSWSMTLTSDMPWAG